MSRRLRHLPLNANRSLIGGCFNVMLKGLLAQRLCDFDIYKKVCLVTQSST